MTVKSDVREVVIVGVRAARSIMRDFWDDFRYDVARLGDRSLDRTTRIRLIDRLETRIRSVFGLSRPTARNSQIHRVVVQSTDDIATRTMDRHVRRVRRLAGPERWGRIASQPIADNRLRQVIAAMEGRLPDAARVDVIRGFRLNPERAWVKGSQRRMSDRLAIVGRHVRKAVTTVVNAARKASEIIPALRPSPGTKMPGAAAVETIIRTETSRVGNEAEKVMATVIPNNGVRYVLADGHPMADACDPHANDDLYGLGRGVYPVGSAPIPPVHPNCRCHLETQALPPERVREWAEREAVTV